MIDKPTFSLLLCKSGQCQSSLTIGGNSSDYAREGAVQHSQNAQWVEGNDKLWSFNIERVGFGDTLYFSNKAIISQSQMDISLDAEYFNKTMK